MGGPHPGIILVLFVAAGGLGTCLSRSVTKDDSSKNQLHMASFNIEVFGTTKFQKQHVIEILRDVSFTLDSLAQAKHKIAIRILALNDVISVSNNDL